MRPRTVCDDIVQTAYNKALLSLITPSLFSVTSELGIQTEISEDLKKDIDISLTATVRCNCNIVTEFVDKIRECVGWCVPDKIIQLNDGGWKATLIVFCGEGRSYVKLSYMVQ